MATIKKLHEALSKMHRRACGDTSIVYMSVPADSTEDADLLLDGALDELEEYRARDRDALNNVRRHNGQPLIEGDL